MRLYLCRVSLAKSEVKYIYTEYIASILNHFFWVIQNLTVNVKLFRSLLSPNSTARFIGRWIWHPAESAVGGTERINNFLRANQEVLNKPSYRMNKQGLFQFQHLTGLTDTLAISWKKSNKKLKPKHCCQVLTDLQRISRLQRSAGKLSE